MYNKNNYNNYNNDIPWDSIQQYVTGNATPECRHRLELWMKEDLENKKIVEDVQEIWDLTPAEEFDTDVEYAWNEFYQNRIKKFNQNNSYSKKTNTNKRFSDTKQIVRIAAIALVAFLAGYVTFHQINLSDDIAVEMTTYAMQELETNSKERAKVSFSDGTEVILNSAGKLRFPDSFNEGAREVYLDGEAYFKVSNQSGRPFIVHTSNATIKVLGTEFNVQAWSDDTTSDIVVQEGQVSVSSVHQQDDREAVLLSKGEYTRVRKGKSPSPAQRVIAENHLLWTAGGLYFDHNPLGDVINQIERIFEVEINLANQKIADVPFTSAFHETDLTNILNVIAATMDLEYELVGETVVLYDADK